MCGFALCDVAVVLGCCFAEQVRRSLEAGVELFFLGAVVEFPEFVEFGEEVVDDFDGEVGL